MWRLLVEPVPLALLGAALLVALVVLRRRYPQADHWSHSRLALAILIGLVVAVLALLALGVFADRHQGPYAPAHIENGRVVPGQFR
jgi:multisubunit Na+/H+ antiporter MnhB subunit